VTEALILPRALADEMIAHCLAGRPNEACGVLGSADGRIVKVFAMTNAEQSPVRYRLDGHEQLAAENKLRQKGWELGGIFHSHTRTKAFPSPTDVREAREDVPYVIVSLMKEPPVIKAFRIHKENWADAEGRIEEIPVEVVAEDI
jgi:[CysO sulfur-carrier protein]-S-L-cysteine hydrolase